MPLAPRFDTLGYVEREGRDPVARCGRCGRESVMNLGNDEALFAECGGQSAEFLAQGKRIGYFARRIVEHVQ